MKYKAIMLDLDDTTVLHGKKNLPSQRVAAAIAKAKEKIHVCVATARPLNDALVVLDHLTLSGPCVVASGAQIYDPVMKKNIHMVPLLQKEVTALVGICQRQKISAYAYDGMREFSVNDIGSISGVVLNIYIPHIAPELVDDMVGELEISPDILVQKLTGWDKRFMDINITSTKATKLHGIVEVARILGITTDEIVGVGDGYNDFPLLMACGLKIAMGNAVPELKAIADFVAPTVEEDGVAVVIEKFVLTG